MFMATHLSKTDKSLDRQVNFTDDNAPSHATLLLKQFVAKKQIPVLEHQPYSPNLAPFDILSSQN
jgi:hypothetical protein